MLLKIFKTFLLYHLVIYNVIAQEGVTIKGVIKDKDNNTPLPYCFIKLKTLSTSTITNEEGAFELHLTSISLDDTVLISYMGYEPFNQPISSLIKNNTGLILLKRHFYSLPEVSIRPELTAQEILQNVYKSFPVNYNDNIVTLKGFFRAYLKTDQIYDKLIEGIFL